MKNFTIAMALLLVMASFTTNLTNTTTKVLTDIEGTLLKSAPIMENSNGEFTVTFTVDKNVIVSSSLIGDSNEIFLLENGVSNEVKSITLDIEAVNGKAATAFNNIYNSNYDVVSMSSLLNAQRPPRRRPRGVMIWR